MTPVETLVMLVVCGWVVRKLVRDARAGGPSGGRRAAAARAAAMAGQRYGPRAYMADLWSDAWTDARERRVAKRAARKAAGLTGGGSAGGDGSRGATGGRAGRSERAGWRERMSGRWDGAWSRLADRQTTRPDAAGDPAAGVRPGGGSPTPPPRGGERPTPPDPPTGPPGGRQPHPDALPDPDPGDPPLSVTHPRTASDDLAGGPAADDDAELTRWREHLARARVGAARGRLANPDMPDAPDTPERRAAQERMRQAARSALDGDGEPVYRTGRDELDSDGVPAWWTTPGPHDEGPRPRPLEPTPGPPPERDPTVIDAHPGPAGRWVTTHNQHSDPGTGPGHNQGGSHMSETTGLITAISHAQGMRQANEEAVTGADSYLADLTAGGVSGPAVAAVSQAMDAQSQAAAAWAAAETALQAQTKVRDAYAGTPGAGTREFVTGE